MRNQVRMGRGPVREELGFQRRVEEGCKELWESSSYPNMGKEGCPRSMGQGSLSWVFKVTPPSWVARGVWLRSGTVVDPCVQRLLGHPHP